MYVFPCNGKRPITPNGLYDAKPEAEWTGTESADWGAPCGELNRFFVVDVDAKKGGLDTAAHMAWGDTLKINTPGGGFHLFYQFDPAQHGDIRNGVEVLPGIDIRSQGGYVRLYDLIEADKIAEAPGWLLETLRAANRREEFKASGTGEVMEGGRNHYLAKAAGSMQRKGLLTMAGLLELNQRDCNPPLPEAEVEAIFESISRYTPNESVTDIAGDPEERPIRWVSDMVGEMFEFLRDKGKTLGESTGIPQLDTLLGGGKRLGELTVTMAEAKTGKNTFWHYQMRDILDRGLAVGYASRELSPETEVLPNLLTLKLNKNLYKEDVKEDEVMQAIKGWRLAFAPGYGAFQGEELFAWMEECLLHGVRYFWIDHLHYCLVDSEDFRLLSEFGRRIKTFAKTHMVHIDLIIQPKNVPFIKQGDKLVPQELDIGLLRGGANLGQVLDSLVTMTRARDDEGRQLDVVKVELKRARSKLARPGFFFMQYHHDKMTFTVCDDPSGSTKEENRMGNTRVVARPSAATAVQPRPPAVNAGRPSVFNGDSVASGMLKRMSIPRNPPQGGE